MSDKFSLFPVSTMASSSTSPSSSILPPISPSIILGFNKPTLFGWRTPFSMQFRNETEYANATLGFSKKIVELESSVTDESGKHSLSHVYALRSILPIAHPASLYLKASSTKYDERY